jgi:hypothetical protein
MCDLLFTCTPPNRTLFLLWFFIFIWRWYYDSGIHILVWEDTLFHRGSPLFPNFVIPKWITLLTSISQFGTTSVWWFLVLFEYTEFICMQEVEVFSPEYLSLLSLNTCFMNPSLLGDPLLFTFLERRTYTLELWYWKSVLNHHLLEQFFVGTTLRP